MRGTVTTIMEAAGLTLAVAGVWVSTNFGGGLIAAGVALVAVSLAEASR
jgi:hypothetical protein